MCQYGRWIQTFDREMLSSWLIITVIKQEMLAFLDDT
jgi:hypothetical protein